MYYHIDGHVRLLCLVIEVCLQTDNFHLFFRRQMDR
jgi:hypothetical protein